MCSYLVAAFVVPCEAFVLQSASEYFVLCGYRWASWCVSDTWAQWLDVSIPQCMLFRRAQQHQAPILIAIMLAHTKLLVIALHMMIVN